MTTVVNLRRHGHDVYIGRGRGGSVPPRPWEYGWLGNPVVVGKVCPVCGSTHNDNGGTLPCYKEYLVEQLKNPEWAREFYKIGGKILGCFCKPKQCHGDVIVEVLDDTR